MLLSRRSVLLAPAAMLAVKSSALAASKMNLSIPHVTTSGAGFQRSLEGYAKAGIKYAELGGAPLDDYLKRETLASARRLVSDLGLNPVACASPGLGAIWITGTQRGAALDVLRLRCDQFASFGITRIVCPTGAGAIGPDEHQRAPDNIRQVGDICKQYGMTALLEFTRNSPFVSTLSTSLTLTRTAGHPNVRPMLDVFHFWAGASKMEDLDFIRLGEIAHVHFEDVPLIPRELLTDPTRVIPGEGVAPLTTILRKLAAKGYSGALSVELFAPRYQQGDPFEVATMIRQKTEVLMRNAKVL